MSAMSAASVIVASPFKSMLTSSLPFPSATLRVTYYRKPGSVLVVVSNASPGPVTTTLSFDGTALGLGRRPRVRDAETTKRIDGVRGAVPITVRPKDFRLILLD